MKQFDYVRFAGKSDIGRKRKNNEDNYGLFPQVGIWLVADGMGGGDDGEIASAAVVRAVESFATANPYPEKGGYPAKKYLKALKGAVNEASKWIFERARERRLESCGSTVVGVLLDATQPKRAIAFHAGDSRLYRLRGGTLKQITRDHSAAEMIGEKDETKVNPMFRGMILRAVGIHPTVEVEETAFDIKKDDRIVICSDGLSRMVPDAKMVEIICAAKDVNAAADNLISAANEAGGVDNVTAIVLHVGDMPSAVKAVPFVKSSKSPVKSALADSPDTNPTRPLLSNTNATVVEVPPPIGDPEPEPVVPAPSRRWVRLLLAGAALMLFVEVVAVCVSVWSENRKRDTSPTKALKVPPAVVEPTLAQNVPSMPSVRVASVGTNVVQKAAATNLVAKVTVTNTVQKAATNLVAKAAATNTVVKATVTNAVQKAAATNLAAKATATKTVEKAVGNSELWAVCSHATLNAFAEQIRRRLPTEKAFEFTEQMKRVQQHARVFDNRNVVKAQERFLVDFKYALQSAASARETYASNVVLKAAWDEVIAGDVHSNAVQKAAVSVIREVCK